MHFLNLNSALGLYTDLALKMHTLMNEHKNEEKFEKSGE